MSGNKSRDSDRGWVKTDGSVSFSSPDATFFNILKIICQQSFFLICGLNFSLFNNSSCRVASAPGKVLITGGYLILERPNAGIVLSTNARFYAIVRPLHEEILPESWAWVSAINFWFLMLL